MSLKIDHTMEEFDEKAFKLSLLNDINDTHLKSVSKHLSISKTFEKGLDLLNSVLSFCTIDTINDYVLKWLDYLLKHPGDNYTEINLSIVGKLIEISYNNHDISKKIVSEYLSKIVELCLSCKNCYEVQEALVVLTICIRQHGSWFTSHKLRIETFIIPSLESPMVNTVENAALAFLFLQQVGNAGIDGANHRKQFHESLQKLCTTFHNLLDQFFENKLDIDPIDRPTQDCFNFNNQIFNSQQLILVTSQRIKNVLIFLTTMIKQSYPVCKDIQPMDLLNVITRGVSVHYCLSTITEDNQFCVNLNNIQVQLIRLLRILIIWLQNHSLPFSFIISKILIDCLKRSKNCKCFDKEVVYQETVYVTLKTWISNSRTGLNPHFQKQLISCILKDITPKKNSVSLKIQTDAKKKKRFVTENTEIDIIGINKDKEELRCQLGLDTLITFFRFSLIRLEAQSIQNIYNLVMSVLNDIIIGRIPHPYGNIKCQLKLFQLLVAFYEQETLSNQPFISQTINILNKFSSSRNTDVATTCKEGLNTLERLCQPVSVPLNIFTAVPIESSQPSQEESIFMECITDLTGNDESFTVETKPMLKSETTPTETSAPIEKESIIMECITDLTGNDGYSAVETKPGLRSEIIILENKVIIPGNTNTEETDDESFNATHGSLSTEFSNLSEPIEIHSTVDIISQCKNISIRSSEEEPVSKKIRIVEDVKSELESKSEESFEELNSFVDEVKY